MYLPRSLIAHLYTSLLRTTHPLSPPVLLLVALDPDALCACRILTALLRRDYIQHKIQPIAGYADLARAGEELVRPMRRQEGGMGGVVVCLGVGGLVDLGEVLGLDKDGEEEEEQGDVFGGVEIWLLDARRPWNLENVFGGLRVQNALGEMIREPGTEKGRIAQGYRPGRGGVIVFDDGDVEDELSKERDAYFELEGMPDVEDEDLEDDGNSSSDDDDEAQDSVSALPERTRKRKSWSDRDSEDGESDEDDRPRQRRRSNQSTPISSPTRPPRRGLMTLSNHPTTTSSNFSRSPSPPSDHSSPLPTAVTKQPSARKLRKRLLSLKHKHESILRAYYSLGTSYSEPISSLMYSLASELGREDNDLLWLAIVGVSSTELYGRTLAGIGIGAKSEAGGSAGWGGDRGDRIRAVLRDEVRRLNPADLGQVTRDAMIGEASGVIPTHARSPTDMAIRLSPEPRFLLVRHWSLYDSMLHSPYLSAKLHMWSDAGRRRLHKLLAKMGVSLTQCKQTYTHMDMELKRGLRERLLKFAPVYGLDGLVPPTVGRRGGGKEGWGFVRCWGWKACLSALDVGVVIGAILEVGDGEVARATALGLMDEGGPEQRIAIHHHRRHGEEESTVSDATKASEAKDALTTRFFLAYDALISPTQLLTHIQTAQYLHRAILRTGTSLLQKKQIRHLRAFRMAVVKEGPDVQLFTHPGALVKLGLWVAEAVAEMEREKGKIPGKRGEGLVLAGLDEGRGVYVVVGMGSGGGVGQHKNAVREQKRKEKREKRAKEREEKRRERERKKQEQRDRRAAAGLESDDEDDDETEESASESSSDEDEEEEMAEETKIRGYGRNRFGNAFQEVVGETGARVRLDSFEHCVVEVKKEDLSGFLENLSMKAVIG